MMPSHELLSLSILIIFQISQDNLIGEMKHRQLQILFLVHLLLTWDMCPDWQASGNMTGYLRTIRGFMDDSIDQGLDENSAAGNISERCNAEWQEFWYVAVIWLEKGSTDAVLVGYAYRHHWYWHNNYGSSMQSFIIWKNTNCLLPEEGAPTTLVKTSVPEPRVDSYSTTVNSLLNQTSTLAGDIWQLGFELLPQLESTTSFFLGTPLEEVAASGIFMDGPFVKFSLRYCGTSSGGNFAEGFIDSSDPQMQMYFYMWTTRYRLLG